MEIQRLAPEMAAAIAAGEVIERPDSVVKELIENSIDSGATSITVDLVGGGLDAISVSDDGCGIPSEQLPIAVERHATSKVAELADLEHIKTLGFRGEALASIAAAGQMVIVSRTTDDDAASIVEAHAGMVSAPVLAPGPIGTTVSVKALFRSMPARLKFMNSARTEMGRVKRITERLAISSPSVRFELLSDGKTVFRTSGNGKLRDVLSSMLGVDTASSMIPVESSAEAPYDVHGLVSAPDHHRPNRSGMNLFLNGRWITSTQLAVAIEGAYSGFLMEGRFPIGSLFLSVPADEIDVNVHPNKREIRFLKEREAFTSLQRSVRNSLLRAYPILEARNLFPKTNHGEGRAMPGSPSLFSAPLQTGAELPIVATPVLFPESLLAVVPSQKMPSLRILGQVAGTYIVAEGPDGMSLIDQHAAHESTLFYQLLEKWDSAIPVSQIMLDPLVVSLSPKQEEIIDRHSEILRKCGLVVERFGDGTCLIRDIPAMSRHVEAASLLNLVLDAIDTGQEGLTAFRAIAASLACHSAIRAGQKLDAQEMNRLVFDLETRSDPQYCPHGRPAMVTVSKHALDRQFGRV